MKKDIEAVLDSYSLDKSVVVTVANITKYEDSQVEIREVESGRLIWRAWDFEPSFYEELDRQLKRFVV